jgi:glyoxylase-like metal-dependent hydrolase (beta-lactamase superfamily II)
VSEESLAARPHLREKTQPLHDAGLIDLVSGEQELLPGVRLVPTPGHTPGHMSIRLDAADRALVGWATSSSTRSNSPIPISCT